MFDRTSRIKDEFCNNPVEFVEFLIARRSLKGSALAALRECVRDQPDRPGMAGLFWLLLLPRRLSLMSVAGRCNLDCRMCGGSRGELKYLDSRSLETMLIHAPTVETVTFVAGDSEPLMNPDLAHNIRLTQQHRANWDLVSNGHLLNEKLVDIMVSDTAGSRLNVSLDACREATYRSIRNAPLGKVLGNLRALRDAKILCKARYPSLSLLMVGMEDNIGELPEFVELAAELQAERVHVDHMMGNHAPGDFLRNPGWPQAAEAAMRVGEQTGVRVELPHDVAGLLLARAAARPPVQMASALPAAATACGAGARLKVLPEDAAASAPKGICPWMDSAHVQLNGVINPCCHVGVDIGNIFKGPLQRNVPYLRARFEHLKGRLHRECLANANCACAGKWKRAGSQPSFIEEPAEQCA
jgi:MoaA/NifB/PqqE/SkfB family radical SAM enzyme